MYTPVPPPAIQSMASLWITKWHNGQHQPHQVQHFRQSLRLSFVKTKTDVSLSSKKYFVFIMFIRHPTISFSKGFMRTKAECPLWLVIKVQTHGKSEITMKRNQPHAAQIYQMNSKVMIENVYKIISDSLSSSSFQPNIFSSFPLLPPSPASQLKCSCIVCEFVETMESETRRWIKDQHAAQHLYQTERVTLAHTVAARSWARCWSLSSSTSSKALF